MKTYEEAYLDSNSSCFCRFYCYILSNYTKNTLFHLCQVLLFALGIFRHHKTLLKHLTFCFNFSLKPILGLLCNLRMLQRLWCPYVTIHPHSRPRPGQSHCSKYHLYVDGMVAFHAPSFMTPLFNECGILLLGTSGKLFN